MIRPTGRAVLMSNGPAVPALLASTAIPGIFPPVTIGRRDFIDGGVANHTPIAAAIEKGAHNLPPAAAALLPEWLSAIMNL